MTRRVRAGRRGEPEDAARARGLAEQIDALVEAAPDTRARFESLRPLVAEALTAFGRAEAASPLLAAGLWCRLGDMLFYLRAHRFDAPEYARAVTCADRADAARLRVHTRILAGRAGLEVHAPAVVRPLFVQAIELGSGEPDLHADATRGLGWVHLAEGQVARARELFQAAHDAHRALRHARGVADASMALAVLERLEGRGEQADALFYRAEAIFRSTADPVRLAKLGALRATLGVPEPGLPQVELDVNTLLEGGQLWRAALVLRGLGDAKSQGRARVLAELAGVGWERLVSEPAASEAHPPPGTWRLVGVQATAALVGPDGATHDLKRRAASRRMLHALASGKTLSALQLFEAAWPGERASWESAHGRVYTTVRRLRELGVPIDTTDDGYVCAALRREE